MGSAALGGAGALNFSMTSAMAVIIAAGLSAFSGRGAGSESFAWIAVASGAKAVAKGESAAPIAVAIPA